MDAMKKFNFSEEVQKCVHSLHTSEIGAVGGTGYELVDDSEKAVAARTQRMIDDLPAFAEKKLASLDTEAERLAYMERRNARIRKQCKRPQPATVRSIFWIYASCKEPVSDSTQLLIDRRCVSCCRFEIGSETSRTAS